MEEKLLKHEQNLQKYISKFNLQLVRFHTQEQPQKNADNISHQTQLNPLEKYKNLLRNENQIMSPMKLEKQQIQQKQALNNKSQVPVKENSTDIANSIQEISRKYGFNFQNQSIENEPAEQTTQYDYTNLKALIERVSKVCNYTPNQQENNQQQEERKEKKEAHNTRERVKKYQNQEYKEEIIKQDKQEKQENVHKENQIKIDKKQKKKKVKKEKIQKSQKKLKYQD